MSLTLSAAGELNGDALVHILAQVQNVLLLRAFLLTGVARGTTLPAATAASPSAAVVSLVSLVMMPMLVAATPASSARWAVGEAASVHSNSVLFRVTIGDGERPVIVSTKNILTMRCRELEGRRKSGRWWYGRGCREKVGAGRAVGRLPRPGSPYVGVWREVGLRTIQVEVQLRLVGGERQGVSL